MNPIHVGSSHQSESSVFHPLLDDEWENAPLAREIHTRLSVASPRQSSEKQQKIEGLCKNYLTINASPEEKAFALLSFAQIIEDENLITRCFLECFKMHLGGESDNYDISPEEQALQDLFKEIDRCSIKISKLRDGSLAITSKKFGANQAECLKKLARFFPKMNLVLGKNKGFISEMSTFYCVNYTIST